MSDESTQFHSLSSDMERLLRWLLDLAPPALMSRVDIHSLKVVPLNDGKMGSLRIYESTSEPASRQFGSKVSEISFLDADGTPISAALLLDDAGRLFEIDLFKADFSPLIAIPLTPDLERQAPYGYLYDLGQELVVLAERIKHESQASEDQFQRGRRFALYEVLSLMKQQAETFGLAINQIGLDKFDIERLNE